MMYGLNSVEMDKLDGLIILAGKNGSGKTRLLQMIRRSHLNIPDGNNTAIMNSNILSNKNIIRFNRQQLTEIEAELKTRDTTREYMIPMLLDDIRVAEIQIEGVKQQFKWSDYIEFINYNEQQLIQFFVPKHLYLTDSYKLSPEEIKISAIEISRDGTAKIEQGCFPAIQLAVNKWHNAERRKPLNRISSEEYEHLVLSYQRFQSLIQTFLGTEIDSDEDGNATIFGKRLSEANLSDGQKVLIQFAMALYGQEVQLGSSIIFMDEPENHLHPAALIEVLDKIHKNIGEGQLWIATHSVHVLAHFDSNSTWYIEDGSVSYAGNVPQKVLKGLLGNEDEMDKLSNYLSLPAKMVSETFAYQCLLAPGVASTGSVDRQTTQIHELIRQRLNEGKRLRVLDYGIGKGRLLAAIAENDRLVGINTSEWLDYYGYDPFSTHAGVCKKAFDDVYSESNPARYFNRQSEALGALETSTFDFIIMCNVLHEIPSEKWVATFNDTNSLMTLLKPDGGDLIVVEDQLLAVGEKAHAKGFLVLDTAELKKLFGTKGDATVISHIHPENSRLKSHFIPATFAKSVSNESRTEALRMLRDNAKAEIKWVREQPPNYKMGKLHSFWTQQFANASLALE